MDDRSPTGCVKKEFVDCDDYKIEGGCGRCVDNGPYVLCDSCREGFDWVEDKENDTRVCEDCDNGNCPPQPC